MNLLCLYLIGWLRINHMDGDIDIAAGGFGIRTRLVRCVHDGLGQLAL
jgi:hypothetical protein